MDKTQLWGDEVIEHPSGMDASIRTFANTNTYSSIYTLFFIVFLLLSFKHIYRSLASVFRCCFRFSHALKVEDNLSLEQGRWVLFILSLMHFSMVIYYFVSVLRVDVYHRFASILVPLCVLFFLLIYFLRRAVFAFIGWVIRSPRELTFLAQGLRDYLILAAVFTFPLSFCTLFPLSSVIYLLVIWCVAALAVCYLLFLYRTLTYFFWVRFSVFFWILYLCGLEIAPLALLYSALTTI